MVCKKKREIKLLSMREKINGYFSLCKAKTEANLIKKNAT